jgi:hypothetical protein
VRLGEDVVEATYHGHVGDNLCEPTSVGVLTCRSWPCG